MHQRFPLRVRGRPFGCLVAHFDAFAFVFEAFDMLSASLSLSILPYPPSLTVTIRLSLGCLL